ncbi:MAG TPA: ribosome maturation factor RimM [Armatimonadota bacterium]
MSQEHPSPEELVAVGQVVGVFGLRGEVKVALLTQDPERLLELRRFYLVGPEGVARQVRCKGGRRHRSGMVLKLEGVNDPPSAEALRGFYLMIPRSERRPLPEGEFYIDDLVGLRVRTEEGRDLGTIQHVLQNPANDVYQTEQVLIPALKDVVVSVDLSAGEVVVRPPAGLLEPEEA